MNDIGFLNSQTLWWTILLLPLIAYLLRSLERRIVNLHRSLGRHTQSRLRVRLVIPLVILALGFFALSRPYLGKQSVTVHGRGRDVFMLIDVSLSMLTQDVSPSRMEFAKRKAHDIIAFLQRNTPEDRVGIILFAGDAYVYCPLTPDYGVVSEFLQSISPELISSRGSSLLRALDVARKALDESKASQPGLIIISDGEDLESVRSSIEKVLEQIAGNTLFLGVGGTEGAPIPLAEGGYLSSRGQIVTSKLNENEIKQIFDSEQKSYQRASILDDDFAPFLKRKPVSISFGPDESQGSQRQITTYGEYGPFILIAMLLVILVAALSRRMRSALLLFFLLLQLPAISWAEPDPFNDSAAYQGQLEYQQGNFQGAYELFTQALEESPDSPILLQSLGSATFKLGKLEEAERAFAKAEQHAASRQERFEAPYNSGNTLLAQKKYKPAIDAFDRALKVTPAESRATHNRTIAEALLKEEEEKKKQQSSEQSSSERQSSSDSSEQQSEEQNRSSENESSEQQGSEQSASAKEESASSSSSDSDRDSGESSSARSDEVKPESSEQEQAAESSSAASGTGTPSPAGQVTPQGEAGSSSATDSIPLSEREANEWLKALPESPLLMQRLNKREQKHPGGQIW